MTPRSTLVTLAFVALATMAAPTAAALGEEVYAVVADVEATATHLVPALQPLFPPAPEPRQEEAARAQEEREHHAPAEPAPEEARAAREAPPSERRSPLGSRIASPLERLLPVPIADVGAAPRVDLSRLLDEVVPLAPLAPANDNAGPNPHTGHHAAPVAAAPAPAAPSPLLAADAGALALAAGVAAAAVAPAAAGALWDRLRHALGLGGALLYSRIAKERLLDHGSRERLLDAIRAKPGLAVADLADATQTPRNTVTYHLRVLEREGLVSSTRNGRNRLYFAPGSLPQRANAEALGALRHETTLAIARAIGETPGVDQKALCERVGLSPSLAHWHADRLVASGLVDKRREGRFVRYYPGASFDIVNARAA